jgi:hypothetical protein
MDHIQLPDMFCSFLQAYHFLYTSGGAHITCPRIHATRPHLASRAPLPRLSHHHAAAAHLHPTVSTPSHYTTPINNGPPANPTRPRPAPLKFPAQARPHHRQSRAAARRDGRHRCGRECGCDSESGMLILPLQPSSCVYLFLLRLLRRRQTNPYNVKKARKERKREINTLSPRQSSSYNLDNPANAAQDCHLAVGHAVEVIGKVDGNLHVKVQAATDFGTNLGMSSIRSLLSQASHLLSGIDEVQISTRCRR